MCRIEMWWDLQWNKASKIIYYIHKFNNEIWVFVNPNPDSWKQIN